MERVLWRDGVFFSCFLIPSNLSNRYGQVAKVDLYAFYVMRFGRIVPPLGFLVLLLSLLSNTAIQKFEFPASLSLKDMLLSGLTLRYNLYYKQGGAQMLVWAILWSLSIKEMFYPDYPVLAKVTRCKILLLPILVAVIVYGPLHRSGNISTICDYFGCFDGIAFGALSAFAAKRFSGSVNRLAAYGFMIAGISILVCTYAAVRVNDHYKFDLSVIAVGAALVLFAGQCMPFASTRSSPYDPLAYLGRPSYEVHFFHMTVFALISIVIVPRFDQHPVLVFTIGTSCVVAASDVISRFYAEPLSRWLRINLLSARKPHAGETSMQPTL